jgi:hypothetical protein
MQSFCGACADKGVLTPLTEIRCSKLLTRCPVCHKTVDLRYGALTLEKLVGEIEATEQRCRALRAGLGR